MEYCNIYGKLKYHTVFEYLLMLFRYIVDLH